jgi:hypothetical protein
MSPAAIQLLGEGTDTPLPTITIPETGATVSNNKINFYIRMKYSNMLYRSALYSTYF